MFNPNASTDTKIAVLEERLSGYEILLNKIDEAIHMMGKTNESINKMLIVHDEKIEQSGRSDNYIVKMIEEHRIENQNSNNIVISRIEKIENKIDEFTKYRWILVGIFAIISLAISQSSLVVELLTPDSHSNSAHTELQDTKKEKVHDLNPLHYN